MFTVEVRVGQCTDLAPHRAGDRSNTGRMRIMAQMTGKVAIVIGAATRDNMGQEIASKLAGAGAKVMAAGRNADELPPIPAAIGGAYRTCAVPDRLDFATLMSDTRRKLGGRDRAGT